MSSEGAAYFTAAWGPGFIGWIIRLVFYGTSVTQAIWYFRVYKEDSLYLKGLVLGLLLMDTLHTYLLIQFFWKLLIVNKTTRSLVYTTHWELPVSVVITSIVIFAVQFFYAVRVWRIGRNRTIMRSIIILACIQITANIVVVGQEFNFQNITFDKASQYAGPIQLGATMLCDLLITSAMVYYLRIRGTGEPRTEAIIQKIIVYSVNLGLLGCVMALLTLILIELPRQFNWAYPGLGLAPGMIISQAYSNSLLGILNARRTFRTLFQPEEAVRLPTIVVTSATDSDD